MWYKTSILFMGLVLLGTSCGSDSGGNSCVGDYDQAALFENMADAVIIPAFQENQVALDDLLTAAQNFSNEPDAERLTLLRSQFKRAYLAYQNIAYFEFGPAESALLNTRMNLFPLNTALLEANIANGQYNLENPNNYYSGLPALDYLLHGVAADDNALLGIYNGPDGEGYKQYVLDVCLLLKSTVDEIVEGWGSYRDTFVANTGTADGSSLGLLVNSLNQQYENMRRDKLGIPAGFQELNAPALPDRVEALYSGLSLSLLRESVAAAQHYFKGGSGEGLDDYLRASGVEKDGQTLDSVILQEFQTVISQVESIPESLRQSIAEGHSSVQDTYIPLGNLVVELKTDMPSALCVSITYIDNPSDSD